MTNQKIVLSVFVAMQLSVMSLFATTDKILATVGNQNITKEDVNIVLKGQNLSYDKLKEKDQQNIINQLIDRKILSMIAYKTDIINSKLYKETLEKVKQDLALQLWMSNMAKTVQVSEASMKNYFDANKEKFKKPLELKARHILVKSQKEAKDIIASLSKAKDLKAEFIKMAKIKSTDGAATNGGDLGWFTLDKMIPEFSLAASSLKVGAITEEPVSTTFGYHVIYLEDKKESALLEYNEIKNDIKQFLLNDQFNKQVEHIIKVEKPKLNILIKK
jgi:parvulin-like peptidyl-prolyl isomerase